MEKGLREIDRERDRQRKRDRDEMRGEERKVTRDVRYECLESIFEAEKGGGGLSLALTSSSEETSLVADCCKERVR